MRFPQDQFPSVGLQGGGEPQFSAPRVATPQDQTGNELQAIGHGLIQAGGVARGLAEEYAATTAKEAFLQFDEQATRMVGQYENLVGKAATGQAREKLTQDLRDLQASAQHDLPDEITRDVFHRAALDRVTALNMRAQQHEDRQVRVYAIGESKAMVEAAKGQAIDEYARIASMRTAATGPYERARNTAVEQTGILADQLGLPQDSAQRRQMLLETTTGMHSGIVERLVADGSPDLARRYLDQAPPDQIDPQQRVRMQDLVRRSSAADRGLRFAMAEMQAPEAPQAPVVGPQPSWAEQWQAGEIAREQRSQAARDKADRLFQDGKLSFEERAHAYASLDQMDREHARQIATERGIAIQQAERWLVANPMGAPASMPPDLLQRVDAFGLRDTVNQLADRKRYVTDQAFRAKLESVRDWSTVDPTQFYAEARGRLDDTDLNYFLTEIRKANGTASASERRESAITEAIRVSALNMGIPINQRDPSGKARDQFERYAVEARDAIHAQPGKPVQQVLREFEAGAMVNLNGKQVNMGMLSPSELKLATVKLPNGVEVPLEDLNYRDPITGQVRPGYAGALMRLEQVNAARRQAGQAPIPATAENVTKMWAQDAQVRQAQREANLDAVMRGKGLTYSAGSILTPGDASALTGLTPDEITERVGSAGTAPVPFIMHHPKTGAAYTTSNANLPPGYTRAAIARLMAQLQEGR